MEICAMGAVELAGRIRRRELSSREVVEAHLARIERVNHHVKAVTAVLGETALAAADEADRKLEAGHPVGELCGVPITVKEGVPVAGSATTHGLVALRDAIAPTDAPHVAELRAAGAIPIARTNMPELGMRWHTDNALHGATYNPWNHELTPGGSSGGEAAAVAAGLSPLGLGTDGAGSLRWPAQCCGVAALKPSHGRVPVVSVSNPPEPLPFAFQLLGVHGPLARRVEDLRLAFRHMCSRSSGDAWHVAAPFAGPEPQRPIRIAVITNPGAGGVHPDVAAAVSKAAALLADAGYRLEEMEVPALARASEIYTQIMERFSRVSPGPADPPPGFFSADFDRFWSLFREPWLEAMGEPSHDPLMERATIARQWGDWMEETPLILAPIATRPAWPVGADLEPDFGPGWLAALRVVVAVNLLGLPSVAAPTGLAGGLPQAVQIIGPRFREDLCLAAAEALEARLPRMIPVDSLPGESVE